MRRALILIVYIHCRFVEGMAPVFSRSAWHCTWHLIQVAYTLFRNTIT